MKYTNIWLCVAAASALWSVDATALSWLGLADEKAQLQDTWSMNNVCRMAYGIPSARWASTADYEEMMGSGNQTVKQETEDFALRAVDTIFTADKRAYDQRTGTLSPEGEYKYPGAVIVKPKGNTVFAGREKNVKPLCVSGKTLYLINPRLR